MLAQEVHVTPFTLNVKYISKATDLCRGSAAKTDIMATFYLSSSASRRFTEAWTSKQHRGGQNIIIQQCADWGSLPQCADCTVLSLKGTCSLMMGEEEKTEGDEWCA